jgi:hypothetical protein
MNKTQFQLKLAELELLRSFSTEAEGPAFLEEENLLTTNISLSELIDTSRDQESQGAYEG